MHGVISSGIAVGTIISGQLVWQHVAKALGNAAGWAQKHAEPARAAEHAPTVADEAERAWRTWNGVTPADPEVRPKLDRRQSP